jgi:DNA processing protein
VLVVEAAAGSGSLRTAQHAQAQGRPLFAIPGSIRNPLARGCHALIRGGARLVEHPGDILLELDIPLEKQLLAPSKPRARRAPQLDKECEILLDALGFDPASFDVLVERTGFLPQAVASLLLLLELDGHVEPHPGGRYGRVQQG